MAGRKERELRKEKKPTGCVTENWRKRRKQGKKEDESGEKIRKKVREERGVGIFAEEKVYIWLDSFPLEEREKRRLLSEAEGPQRFDAGVCAFMENV